MRQLRALVFDMDGTLADSDPLHLRAFQETLGPLGVAVDEAFYRERISGRTNAVIFADLFPRRASGEQERLADAKEAAFRRIAGDLRPLAGLSDLLAFAAAQGLALGVVTNAPRANADHMLEALGLADRFPVQVAGGEVARGKPDPLPYRIALDRLDVGADEAVAFEDSVSGVTSAAAAGLATVGVLTGQAPPTLRDAGAQMTIPDFGDADLWRYLRGRLPPMDRAAASG